MKIEIELDEALRPALMAIDPAVWVEDGDDANGEFRGTGEFIVVDAELQTICVVSKKQWGEPVARALADAIAKCLDQAARSVP